MKYISNSTAEIVTEMVLEGKTKAQIKAEDLKRANTFKVLLSNDKVDELAYKWGAKFSRGTK